MAASASDAHPFPIYNARFRVTFPILDADGDLVTGAASLDSELSQDSGTFADATNEATEIATSSGMYFLDLVAGELDTKSTAIIVKTGTAGAKTTPLVLYPKRLPVIRTGTAQAGAASTITLDSGASAITDYYVGCYVNPTNNTPTNVQGQARRITAYNGSTKVATVEGTYGTNPSSSTTFEILATEEWFWRVADLQAAGGVATTQTGGRPEVNTTHAAGTAWNSGAIGAATLASDTIAAAKIATGAITAAKFAAGAIDAAAIATGAIDADSIASDAITAAKVAADVSAEIADAVWDEASADHVGAGSVGERVERLDIIAPGGSGGLTNARAALLDNLDAAVSTRSTLDAAGVRSAVGLAAANLDTQLDTIDNFIDTEVAAIKAKTDTLPDGVTKNAALNNFAFFMVDSADHVTGKTGLTITAERSLDGAAFAACANAATELANGVYKINLAAGDLNADIVVLKFTATGADATVIVIKTEA